MCGQNLAKFIVLFIADSLTYLCGMVGEYGRTTVLHHRVRGQYSV